MKSIMKEFSEGVITILMICLYLVFFSALLRFTMRSPAVVTEDAGKAAAFRIQPFTRLRQKSFHELSANQTSALDEMTREWCGLFDCKEEKFMKQQKEWLRIYQEFCKEVLLDAGK